MGPRARRANQRWFAQPLTPLIEGPESENYAEGGKKERSWDVIRQWVRSQKEKGSPGNTFPVSFSGNSATTKQVVLKLLLGVLACPLAPVSLLDDPLPHISVKDTPIETSSANYIIRQYLAATRWSKLQMCVKSIYAAGTVKMVCCETEIAGKSVKNGLGGKNGENGCFVLWQMAPEMWSVEMVVAGAKVVAGCNGKVVWRHTPWLGTHAAKGPQRPLRRLIQGLDPKSTACMFAKAQCLGEKRIGDEDCFILKVAVDRATVVERSEGPTNVIRHVLYGYFSQKTGLLVYMEDSHLTKVQVTGTDTIYWETTIGTIIEDYMEVEGMLIAQSGRSVATVFRFGEVSMQYSRTRMEEAWRINDVVFNVPGLSMDCFLPPTDIFLVPPQM